MPIRHQSSNSDYSRCRGATHPHRHGTVSESAAHAQPGGNLRPALPVPQRWVQVPLRACLRALFPLRVCALAASIFTLPPLSLSSARSFETLHVSSGSTSSNTESRSRTSSIDKTILRDAMNAPMARKSGFKVRGHITGGNRMNTTSRFHGSREWAVAYSARLPGTRQFGTQIVNCSTRVKPRICPLVLLTFGQTCLFA